MIVRLLEEATKRLAHCSESPRIDAEVLLSHVLTCQRSYFYTWPNRELTPLQQEAFEAYLQRREHGEPIAYILKHREFWSLSLEVTQATLIPRPDTECLVEWVLAHANQDEELRLADLGTGSGAIACALASECSRWHITATDQSELALDVARSNAQRLQLKSIDFIQGSWCEALPRRDYHWIISNPPYIADHDPHLQQGDLRYEPQSALVSNDDGLNDLRTIIQQAPHYLQPGGYLVLEHGYEQGKQVASLMNEIGFSKVENHRDYAGKTRFSTGIWSIV